MSFRAEHSHLRDFGVTTQIQITVTVYAISTAPAVAALVPVPFAAWPPWVASRDYRVNCHRNPIAHYIENGNNRFGESRAYFFLAARPARAAELAATAARMSCWKAASLIFSPSRRSIARRVFPSRLELKRFFGSLMEAPRGKVSFTTCLYDSPVQTMPSWDQTGIPGDFGFSHFHSSWMSGSASWMSRRT
jgi:hypothetical protein